LDIPGFDHQPQTSSENGKTWYQQQTNQMNFSSIFNDHQFQHPMASTILSNKNSDHSSSEIPVERNSPPSDRHATPATLEKLRPRNHERNSFVGISIASGMPFPFKLHSMLDNAAVEGYAYIVSWEGDNGFMVHNKGSFVKDVIPRYFSQTQYRSFQRLLNMWGFERLRNGPRKGAYTHLNLKRGNPSLCNNMRCQKIKRRKSAPTSLSHHKTAPKVGASTRQEEGSVVSVLQKKISISGDYTTILPLEPAEAKPSEAEATRPVDMFEGKPFHRVSTKDRIDRKCGK
jgi:hypothetical protein